MQRMTPLSLKKHTHWIFETENTTEEESGDNNAAEEGWTELDKDGWENVLGR